MATKLRRKDVVELLAQRTERYTPGYSGHIEDARYYWDKGGGSGPLWHLISRAKDFGLLKEAPSSKRTASLRRAVKRSKAKRRTRHARARLRRRLSRRRRAMSLPKVPHASFEKAKAERDAIEAEVSAAGEALQVFPKSPLGGVSDSARVTPEYRAAKRRFDTAFSAQRRFNEVFVKTFAKELRAERAARYPTKRA